MIDDRTNILITGGAGFIGGTLVRKLLLESNCNVFNLDKVTNRSDLTSINNLLENNNIFRKRYTFFKLDLLNIDSLKAVIEKSNPDLIFHFAAESHVDRSINSPKDFILNNILGTYNLLYCARTHFEKLTNSRKNNFRFHHISTDEVFGSLSEIGKFSEKSNYDPRSPYSATKASSDHLVNAWFHTYGLPVITTNCSNNYGPWQFPDKLIPLVIMKCLSFQDIPVYGDGKNIRDWLHVDDHIEAILIASEYGEVGKKYLIGGNNERNNKEIVQLICNYLDFLKPNKKSYNNLIKFVPDRPGHDYRYALDSSLFSNKFGWRQKINFKDGLEKTVLWYMNNLDWCKEVSDRSGYSGQRLGLI